MRVELNGVATELHDDTTLLALIEAQLGTTRGSAVVVDSTIVPRAQWPATLISAGQRIELIMAVQGG